MVTRIKIDFVSDVSCPWCAAELSWLKQALSGVGGEIEAESHFQPFELNPDMPPEGQDTVERLPRKYGMTPGNPPGQSHRPPQGALPHRPTQSSTWNTTL